MHTNTYNKPVLQSEGLYTLMMKQEAQGSHRSPDKKFLRINILSVKRIISFLKTLQSFFGKKFQKENFKRFQCIFTMSLEILRTCDSWFLLKY